MEITDKNENEIYTVDYNKNSNTLMFGGNNQKCTIFDTASNYKISEIEGFTDSVIFVKHLQHDTYLICTLDGNILITTSKEEKYTLCINEEISFVEFFNNTLIIGTMNFVIYKFDIDNNWSLINQTIHFGHSSEIQQIKYDNNLIYSLSVYSFIVFDAKTSTCLLKHKIMNSICFSYIPNTELYCIGTHEYILFYKSTNLINKIPMEGHPECICYLNEYFVVGGYFNYLILINTKMNLQTYKISIETTGINKIIPILNYTVAFSTLCGFVGTCDIRKSDSIQLFETKVDVIFDFNFYKNIFFVGGLKGIDILSTDDFE